jgi:hypothetical protein
LHEAVGGGEVSRLADAAQLDRCTKRLAGVKCRGWLTPLNSTVGLLVSLHSHLLHHSPSISMITADYKTATKAIANEKHPLV